MQKANKFILNGEKSFVTMGSLADQYIVLAKVHGTDETDKAEFKIVLVNKGQSGVSLTELPPLPFVSHVPHAKVKFENVRIGKTAVGS